MSPAARNMGDGPTLRERVPTPQSPFHPADRRAEFIAWQEGLGAGIKFMAALCAAVAEDEECGQ